MNNTTITKKYISVQSPTEEVTHLKVELYYSMGGWNYFVGRQEPRGYYLSVTPVKRWKSETATYEQFTAFTGCKTLIKEVARKSKKAEREAIALAESKEQELVAHITKTKRLKLFNLKERDLK